MLSRLNLLGSIRGLPRDLRLLFFSLFLWTFGLGVYNYVWSIYLTELHANPEQVGLVSSIGFIFAAISMIPGGVLANKYDAKTLLIVGWAMSIPAPILFYYSGTWSDVIPGLIILQLLIREESHHRLGQFTLPRHWVWSFLQPWAGYC